MTAVDLWQAVLLELGRPDILETRPRPDFDLEFYCSYYIDMATAPDPATHFDRHGRQEGRFGTRYQLLRDSFANLDRRLGRIVRHPLIGQALEEERLGAAEVLFELIALGDPVDWKVSDFSHEHYLSNYRDIADGVVAPMEHFLRHGITEGRRSLAALRANHLFGGQSFDPARPSCLICMHEMSRTGAPIVGRNLVREASQTHNVLVCSLRGGSLLQDFLELACEVLISENPLNDFNYLNSPVLETASFAILNSVEGIGFIPPLVSRGIPFASYLHEYTEYVFPVWKTTMAALQSDILVFSSGQVRRSWLPLFSDVGFDVERDSFILAQEEARADSTPPQIRENARQRISEILGVDCGDRRLIYGAGHVQPRKGTDLFVMTAQIARRFDPDALFIWIGDGSSHEDIAFGIWLDKHLREVGVNTPDSNLFFLPAGPYYRDICRAADTLFLSSRLDPLPNVVFDALKAGCHVLAFENASGFDDAAYADLPQISTVPYGDLGLAAEKLIALPPKPLAPRSQDRPSEPPRLFAAILEATETRRAEQDFFVHGPGRYDVPGFFSMREADRENRRREREKIWSYGRDFIWRDAAQARARIAQSDNWTHQRVRIDRFEDLPQNASAPEPFSIHVHAYYLDDLEAELLAHAAYAKAERIFVTTNTQEKLRRIAAISERSGIPLLPRLCPNRGRDILPFMDLVRETGGGDEIWCHVHQKKSVGSASTGDVWRQFLMRILLGDAERLSSALTEIARPDTGLVTAFDPYILGWSANHRLLDEIAPRLPGPLPKHPLLFPVGNMFWARGSVVTAMNTLFKPGYPWPNEPLPNDGTVFHLIERLWPAAACMAGLDAVFLEKPDQRRV